MAKANRTYCEECNKPISIYSKQPCMKCRQRNPKNWRTCPECGERFFPKNKEHHLCSPSCRIAYHNRRTTENYCAATRKPSTEVEVQNHGLEINCIKDDESVYGLIQPAL